MEQRPKNLLIVECQSQLNWYQIFQDAHLSDGTPLRVEQSTWDDLSIVSFDSPGIIVYLNKARNPLRDSPQSQERTMTVDFVLLRSVTRSIKGQDSSNKLLGLIHAGLPSVNSLQSAYLCKDRPVVFGELKKIEKKLGHKNFPLIPQTLYTDYRNMIVTPSFPLVAKVAHTHAGYGKMKFEDNHQFQDFKGLVAIHNDYVSVEPYVKWDYDMRIQKIGSHYRAFKRRSPYWKGNVGNQSIVSDAEMTPEYKLMADECAKIFGGIDILGLDLLHSEEDGKEYILELNDTAIGLVHEHEHEDMCNMRDLVLFRMSSLFCNIDPIDPIDNNSNDIKSMEDIRILEFAIDSERKRYDSLVARQNAIDEEPQSDFKIVVWIESAVIIVLLAILLFTYLN